MEFKYDFFISYNHKDEKLAEWIAWLLEDENYSVFIQAWDFQSGNNFVLQMQEGSTKSKHTLALLSSNYLSSLNTQPEWASAFASDPTGISRRLIAVRIEDIELPGLLTSIIYIDLVGKNEEEIKSSIRKGVQEERLKPATAPHFPGVIERKDNSTEVFTESWYDSWLDKRLLELENGKAVFRISKGPKYSIHLLPVESITQKKEYPTKILAMHKGLKPLLTDGWDHKINKDGFTTYVRGREKNETHSYVQLYKNGIIEAVETGLLSLGEESKRIIIDKFEEEIIEHIKLYYLKALKNLDIKLPIAVGICLYNIEGYTVSSSRTRNRVQSSDAIEQATLKLPVIQIHSWNDDIEKILQPSFDVLWNHCGFEGSLNYDEDGKWNVYRGF